MASFGSDLLRSEPREPARQPSMPSQQTPMHQASLQTGSHAALSAVPAASKVAVLGPTLRFKGELSAEEDFILQGTLEGSISNPQCVTIGSDGSVIGDIKARIITIDGKIEGDLHGVEAVIVHETGRVKGNIYAPRVGIVEGAFFSGRIEMVEKPSAQSGLSINSGANASARLPSPSEGGVRVPSPNAVVPGVPLTPEETERMLMKK